MSAPSTQQVVGVIGLALLALALLVPWVVDRRRKIADARIELARINRHHGCAGFADAIRPIIVVQTLPNPVGVEIDTVAYCHGGGTGGTLYRRTRAGWERYHGEVVDAVGGVISSEKIVAGAIETNRIHAGVIGDANVERRFAIDVPQTTTPPTRDR